jgi:type IV pilus assembly protein PilA
MITRANASVLVGMSLAVLLSLNATACMKNYLNNAKMAEARNNVGAISRQAAAAFDREQMPTTLVAGAASGPLNSLCKSATKKVPSSASDIMGKKYMSSPSDWSSDPADTGFTCLKYTNDVPQYYMYNYTMTGKGGEEGDSYSVTAEGDLNGDGVLSKFELTGKISGHAVVVSPSIKETNPSE